MLDNKASRYTVKKVSHFTVHSRDVTYQTLPWQAIFIFSLVSDIPAGVGTGKSTNFFTLYKKVY